MNALELVGVSKRFADVVAVDDVSFELGDGEVLALVGPSGCGKSTLLRIIAGLHRSDAGSIVLDGVTVDDADVALAPERRRVGLVFQEHALFPHLTVARNVAFGVGKGAAAAARVAEMLHMVGLADLAERYPHELSGGERQRVALARALAPAPALMLLDEPFASLDPNLRSRIRDDVVAILRASHTPAVFVTHDQAEALAIGDRIAVMRDGVIVQLDTPQRVFHAPADRFVGAFMGEADFMTAAAAVADLGADPFPEAAADTVVMVRPDDVTFREDPDGTTTISDAEFRGSNWCYTLRLPSGAEVRSLRSHLTHIEPGTAVTATIVAGHRPVVVPT